MCVQGDLKAVEYGQAGRVVETTFFGYKVVSGGSKEPWNMWLRARRSIGGLLRGPLAEVMRSCKNFTISEKVIAADVRKRSHRPHCARRTKSKFAFL
jgi:hypothetical protein